MNKAQFQLFMQWRTRRALRRGIARKMAAQAGARGVSASPMVWAERVGIYMQQNNAMKLTPAQKRRATKKFNRAGRVL